jgi:tRNA(Ile2) C34 agmatinyltransferase TiaS
VQVDQSVQQSGGVYGSQGGVYGSPAGTNNVQAMQGTVRQVDRTNGLFTLQANNGAQIVVSMPYNPTRNDVSRFESLRSGDNVRFYGVFLNNSRVELRQFY